MNYINMLFVLYLAPQVLSPSRHSCPLSGRILMYCHTLQADRENKIKQIIVSDVDDKHWKQDNMQIDTALTFAVSCIDLLQLLCKNKGR